MSRVGKTPIPVPSNVTVAVNGGRFSVSGPGGKVEGNVPEGIELKLSGGQCSVTASQPANSAVHGLTRSLVANAVKGVQAGWEKKLELVGVGFQASLKGANLSLVVGFSHPVVIPIPVGIKCELPDSTHIIIKGVDRQVVGQVAANIRAVRPPEPYKGKGIKYSDEHVRRKAGKAFGS